MFGFCDAGFVFDQGVGGDMDDETGSVACSVDDVDEDGGAPGRSGPVIARYGRSGIESGSHLLPGFDVDPAVDPHHLPLAAETERLEVPDQLAFIGQVFSGHPIQPVIDTFPQLPDQRSTQGSRNQFGLVPGERLGCPASCFHQHIHLRTRNQTLVESESNHR